MDNASRGFLSLAAIAVMGAASLTQGSLPPAATLVADLDAAHHRAGCTPRHQPARLPAAAAPRRPGCPAPLPARAS